MKKLFSFVLLVAAVAMVSCAGNANKKAAEAEAATTPAVEQADTTKKCCDQPCDKPCDKAAETPAETPAK
jgi:hypothetical protein